MKEFNVTVYCELSDTCDQFFVFADNYKEAIAFVKSQHYPTVKNFSPYNFFATS